MTTVDSLDGEERLAEGRPAVEDFAEYVMASQRLGYRNPDLTTHPSQVRDWYGSEDGLDLRALDADCAALARAADAAEDAARTHGDLVAELSGAWSGRGAAAAREFAWRSGQAALSVSSSIRGAADALATLRDELWRAVDAKVATVQAIDGRHAAQREQWLAAARTVTTGTGDLASASELVDHQVKPFVIDDIGSDWIGAMRAAAKAIGAAYDAAIVSSSTGAPAVFDVPGELGPRAASIGRPGSDGGNDTVVTTAPAAAVTPSPVSSGMPTAAAAFNPPAASAASPGWAAPIPASSPAAFSPQAVDPFAGAPPAAAVPAATSMPPMGELGGATPEPGAGVSGFGQQLADLIGGLVGSAGGADGLPGTDGSFEGPDDEPLEAGADGTLDEETEDDDGEGDGDEPSPDDEPDLDAAEEPAADAAGEDCAATDEESAADPVPEPTVVPPPPAPDGSVLQPAVPDGVAETTGPTPCEIAADELPQVGE